MKTVMTPAERIVKTINNAVTISGLEMINEPHLMQYVTGADRQMMKRNKQRLFRIQVIRRVLRADLKQSLATLQAIRNQEAMIDQARYCDTIKKLVEKVPDRNLLAAVEKLQDVLNNVGLADHARMMGEAIQAGATPAPMLGKQRFGVAA